MIIIAWIFGPTVNIVRLIPTSKVTSDGICIQYLIWPSQFWFTFTSVVFCTLLFFLPLLFIMSLYLSIFIYLRKKTNVSETTESRSNQTNKLTKAKANVLKTLVLLTALFFLCWVWNTVFIFLFSIGVKISTTGPFYNFSVFMMNINCCVNPFCYAVQYREFQTQARKLFCSKIVTEQQEDIVSRNTSQTAVS